MKIQITSNTALRGLGQVKIGEVYTEKDADPIELKRLIAFGKAIEVIDAPVKDKNAKPSAEDIQANIMKAKTEGAGLTTKTAGALK